MVTWTPPFGYAWLEDMLPNSEGMSITHFLAWSSTSTSKIFERGHSYDDADMLSADNLGKTCLQFAASRGNLGVLSYLLRRVSLEDVERKDVPGRFFFRYAVHSSRAARVIEILMGRGCNVYAVDETKRTALHWAARWNNFKAVKKLIAIADGSTLLLSDRNGRMLSMEVSQRRAPVFYEYLRHLEFAWGLSREQPQNTPLRHDLASYCAGLDFSLVLQIGGILIMIFMILLGISD